MYTARFHRLLLVSLAVLLALVTVAPAFAAQPEIKRTVVDDTFTVDDVCAFPLEVHVEGIERDALYYDQAGNLVQVIATFPRLRVTLTNLETGESLSFPSPSVATTKINPDGSYTVTVTGLSDRLVVPGQGAVAMDVGRFVDYYSGPDDQEPDTIFEAGRFDASNPPHICEVLA
jgi:hypothetical protein